MSAEAPPKAARTPPSREAAPRRTYFAAAASSFATAAHATPLRAIVLVHRLRRLDGHTTVSTIAGCRV